MWNEAFLWWNFEISKKEQLNKQIQGFWFIDFYRLFKGVSTIQLIPLKIFYQI